MHKVIERNEDVSRLDQHFQVNCARVESERRQARFYFGRGCAIISPLRSVSTYLAVSFILCGNTGSIDMARRRFDCILPMHFANLEVR